MIMMEQVPDSIPTDCDMVVYGPAGVEYVKKEDVIMYKRSIRNLCPCEDGKRMCKRSHSIQPASKFKLHIWFDKGHRDWKDWPYEAKYPCSDCPVGYRHFHKSYLSRSKCTSKCDPAPASIVQQLLKNSMVHKKQKFRKKNLWTKTTLSSDVFEAVSPRVKEDCEMVVTSQEAIKYLNKSEAIKFMMSISKRCLCKNDKCSIKSGVGFMKYVTFDAHAKTIKNWPFVAKYPCSECPVGFRHYHPTYIHRSHSASKYRKEKMKMERNNKKLAYRAFAQHTEQKPMEQIVRQPEKEVKKGKEKKEEDADDDEKTEIFENGRAENGFDIDLSCNEVALDFGEKEEEQKQERRGKEVEEEKEEQENKEAAAEEDEEEEEESEALESLELKKVSEDIPMDIDTVIFTTEQRLCLKKNEGHQFKWLVRNKCPCQNRQRLCPVSLNNTSVHIWFDIHAKKVKDWPYTTGYICHGCSKLDVRHYHSSFERRRSSQNYHGKRIEMQVDIPRTNVTMLPERVEDYIPDFTDMLIIKPNSLEFLDEEEAKCLKQHLIHHCLCQNSSNVCPLACKFNFDANFWFDEHILRREDWIFPVKYVCNRCPIGYRHYHDSYKQRPKARRCL